MLVILGLPLAKVVYLFKGVFGTDVIFGLPDGALYSSFLRSTFAATIAEEIGRVS